jgi:hypothetical protein
MNRALPAALLTLSAVGFPASASAQDPPPSTPASAIVPTPVPLQLFMPSGEPTSAGGVLPPSLAVLPLRLSLMGATFPIAGALPGDPCASREESSGNTVWGFPMQHATYLPLTPQLTLSGFSSRGCPLDAAIGGGASYAITLPDNLWLVVNAGLLSQPGLPGVARTRADLRLDLMMRPSPDRAYALGLGRRGVTFTGQW